MCHLLHYVCFTGKSENLAETPILKDIFIFLANGHSFQKCSFLGDILSFLKEVFSVFEKCQILMELFLFGKKYHFVQKVLVSWQKDWIFKYSDKIMSCKLWNKVTSVFLNINFCAKLSILGKKIEFREKCWFFQTIVHYYWKWSCYWKTCLFSENCDFKLLFWFKISFHSVIFWIKVSFLGKIYISDGINLWTNWAIFWEWC